MEPHGTQRLGHAAGPLRCWGVIMGRRAIERGHLTRRVERGLGGQADIRRATLVARDTVRADAHLPIRGGAVGRPPTSERVVQADRQAPSGRTTGVGRGEEPCHDT